ncbi:hypothetical protein GE09DRAFT_287063 [Coniochaeta sp. 2T2.1]|nr:hypothetical protein GE09DRAFT_287063 [Coniochaeta sp. 2T2.1]
MPPCLCQALFELRGGRAPLLGGQGEEPPQGPAPVRREPASQSVRRTTKPPPPVPATPAARRGEGNSSAASAPNASLSMTPLTTTAKRPVTSPATNSNSEPQPRSKKPRKSGVPAEPPADARANGSPQKGCRRQALDLQVPLPGTGVLRPPLRFGPGQGAPLHQESHPQARRRAALRHVAPCHRDVQRLHAHMSELGMQRYGYQGMYCHGILVHTGVKRYGLTIAGK